MKIIVVFAYINLSFKGFQWIALKNKNAVAAQLLQTAMKKYYYLFRFNHRITFRHINNDKN